MSHVVTLSDSLYAQLQSEAQARGLSSIERLLEQWQLGKTEGRRRKGAVAQVDLLRKRLKTAYGEMPDSSIFVRSDRER